MAKYTSGRQKNLKIGISSYSENLTSLEVIGKVGIGTTNPTRTLDVNGDIRIRGGLYDVNNQSGTSGQLLVSTATGVDWQDAGSISAIQTIINTSLTGIGISEEGVGIGTTFTRINFIGPGVTASANGTSVNVTVADYVSNAGVSTSVIGGIGSITQLQVTGVSTFTNGPILVGTATSTGTASQRLQVTGGAYVSGNLGIGTTNPTSKLHVVGDVRVSGVVTATTFVGALTGTATSTTNIPNLTGAITSVNTTTSLGSFTSAQLATALTDETGSGSAVFATSPTLVTPVLGAASATSIVVSSGSTFTNGPILVGTATSTGTASQALQVNSGAYVSGNLGVGATNPTSKLQVQGDGRFVSSGQGDVTITHSNLVSTIRGASTVQLALGANGTEVIRINNSSQVGIATTNPVATLQVKDALAFETTNTTTSSTSQVAVDTFATATFRSAKYQVQMTCPGQLATLGGITTGGSGYTAGTFNVTFSNSSGTGAAAQGTLTISNGTVSQIGVGTTGGSGYTAGDVLTAAGGSGLQVSVGSTASPSGAILTLGAITSAGIGYTSGVGVGTTTLAFLGGTGTGAVGLATIFDGVITSSTLLQQPTTGTGGTTYYSGSNYTTATVLTIAKTDVTNTITDIAGSVGVSTFTSLTAHGIGVSDTVRVSSTSNGLTAGTNYFVVTTPTPTTFTLGSSVGIGTTFTTGSSLSIGFYRNSANAGGSVAYLNAITGVSTNFQVSDLMVLQNGATADFVEYGTIANNDVLGTFAADISGANTRLLVTPTYATNTVKVARQAITV